MNLLFQCSSEYRVGFSLKLEDNDYKMMGSKLLIN